MGEKRFRRLLTECAYVGRDRQFRVSISNDFLKKPEIFFL